MGYGIVMRFSKENEDSIMQLACSIDKNGIENRLIETKMPPHISLAVFDDLNEEEVKGLINNFDFRPIWIDFLATGSFPGEKNTIILIPKVTSEMLEMHKSFHGALNNIKNCWRHYLPANWVPHCTVGIDINNEDFLKAFGIVRNLFRPIKVQFQRISLIKFQPVEIILEKDTVI